jgi:putative endonuclease
MYWVYVLRSKDSLKRYVGMTNNFERRLREHNSGHTKSTRNNKWEIIYKEELMDRVSARKREKYLKSAAGRRYLQKYLAS